MSISPANTSINSNTGGGSIVTPAPPSAVNTISSPQQQAQLQAQLQSKKFI